MSVAKFICAITVLSLSYLCSTWAADPVSGLAIGKPTLSFTVMDVTGTYKGKRICYVCEYQNAPVVISFYRDTGDETAKLIGRLNDLYLNNKDRNLKAFAVIMAGKDAAPWLEDLQKKAGIQIPMVYLRKGPKDVAVRMYHLDPAVKNTFLVAVDRTVKANLSDLSAGDFNEVADATTQMLTAAN